MAKQIIVAGGGHGGIAAAHLLAKRGYDVTVYERHTRENMGYDWTDIFDKKGFFAAEMDLPAPDKFCLKQDMTFIGPGETIKLQQHTEPDKLEIQMERKAIYDHLNVMFQIFIQLDFFRKIVNTAVNAYTNISGSTRIFKDLNMLAFSGSNHRC